MKITTLIENTSEKKELIAQHGLSIFIEHNGLNILFDCGQDDSFFNNAKKMNIDLMSVDYCIISHGHYDHSGGLKKFLNINKKAKIIMSDKAFDEYYGLSEDGEYKYIGLDKEIYDSKRFILIGSNFDLTDTIKIISKFDNTKNDNQLNTRLFKFTEGKYIRDMFDHEIAMIINSNEKNILISGCFHSGVVNVLKKAENVLNKKITHIIGGYHLSGRNGKSVSNEQIDKLSRYLIKNNIFCYTGHCSGLIGYNALKNNGVNICYTSTGSVFII